MLFIGLILLITLMTFTAFSVVKVFILLAFYICCFERYGYLTYFPGFTLWYYWKISYPLLVVLICYWAIYLLKNQENFLLNQMDTAVILLAFLLFLGIIHGLLRGYSTRLLFSDAQAQPFILAYFIFLYSAFKDKIQMFYDALLLFAFLVSFQFMYAVLALKSSFFLQRIVSIHIHIVQFAIPYILATLIYSTSQKRKIFFAVLLPVVLLGVFISQQRALYGSIGLSVLFLIGLFTYMRRTWIKNNIQRFALYSICSLSVTAVVFMILQAITEGKFLLTLYRRILVFSSFEQVRYDMSWKIRWEEIVHVFKNFKEFWLLGQGFGASFITRNRYWLTVTVDNAYAYVIWKTGIIGLMALIYVYYVFFKRCLSTMRKNITANERIFLTTALLNAVGMMLIAFTNCSIAQYRLIFVWMAIFACTEAIARRYD